MPLYDMHCVNGECSYTGEHLLRSRNEALQCPECKTGILERDIIQPFNIGGRSKNKHQGGQQNNGQEMKGIGHFLSSCQMPEGSEVEKSVVNGYDTVKVKFPCGCISVSTDITDVITQKRDPTQTN